MKIVIVFCAVLFASVCSAQNLQPFKQLRYDEDYSFLKDDSTTTWYDRLKFRPINSTRSIYLSIGGDVRYQYLYFKNEDWGDMPEDDDGFTLTRWLTHVDLHIHSRFRVFTELQSAFANSRIPAAPPIEENPLDLHQAFVDWNTVKSPNLHITIRAGRQEIMFGSQRLVSVRDAPNARQSFDGIRMMIDQHQNHLNIFYANYVKGKSGIFDDSSNGDHRFYGAYFSRSRVPLLRNMDAYYVGFENTNAMLDDGGGDERRHTFGMRVWDMQRAWKYDLEGIYQTGTLDQKSISAWSVSLISSYMFSQTRLKPEIGVKTELISGNKKYTDNKTETVNPLFPQGAYFGLAAKIGPANLMDIHPAISIVTKSNVRLSMDYAAIWRYSLNDGIYRGNMSMIYSGQQGTSRYIGGQLSGTVIYPANKFILLICGFSWFDAQAYLKEAGTGEDIWFGFTSAQLKF
ncbi:MAG: alginate export family protein [Cyclobacteriaceae bacterium]|nr:alginate export family protein [Cyclobacteriaceae bacterium]